MNPVLTQHIHQSPLQEFEKEILEKSLGALTDEQQQGLAELFETKAYLIPILYVNFLAKAMAASNRDQAAFSRVVEQELELLESLEKV